MSSGFSLTFGLLIVLGVGGVLTALGIAVAILTLGKRRDGGDS